MTLNASGPMSIGGSTAGQSINLEFGRAANATTSMSELYRNGTAGVGSGAPNVPTSGAISLSQFYGAANRIALGVTIASPVNNYVASSSVVPGYTAGISDVTFTINSGVLIGSPTGAAAFQVSSSWNPGDTVKIVNNGTIMGIAGNGNGGSGGVAFQTLRPVTIDNTNGVIGGGGGGGGYGAGGSSSWTMSPKGSPVQYAYAVAAGGGGGAGRGSPGGSGGGINGSTSGAVVDRYAQAGQGSSSGGAGNGGLGSIAYAGQYVTTYACSGGTGGAGGGLGAPGGAGGGAGSYTYGGTWISAGGGGPAGAAVSGYANTSWIAVGQRFGPTV